MNVEPITVIFFSCRRVKILDKSICSFVKVNTYPITEYIIVNDSGDIEIHKKIRDNYEGVTFVFNPENVGLMKSIDIGYAYIQTEYFLHCEDDWVIKVDGFIQNALAVMRGNPEIEEVWPCIMNFHPIETRVYTANNVKYRLVAENHQRGPDGMAWHGFTTSCALKRLSDYKKAGLYTELAPGGTVWDKEKTIGERYHQLGYRTAVLNGEYAVNIGYGVSEYLTGLET
jgi:hypothetical protein